MTSTTWQLICLGTGAGFASGLLGIGGGVIYVPALMYIVGLPIHLAIGVSLALIVPSAAAAAIKHYVAGNVDIPIVLIAAPFSIVGAVLGAYAGSVIPASVLKRIFGVCLILIGLNTVLGWTDSLKEKAATTTTTATDSHSDEREHH